MRLLQLARAVQTALVTFEHSDAPIIVHSGLAEIRPAGGGDYCGGGKWPRGKPGCEGLPKSELRQALDRVGRGREGALPVSLSGVDTEQWFKPYDSEAEQVTRLNSFVRWIENRPERRIALVSHGQVLNKVSHTSKRTLLARVPYAYAIFHAHVILYVRVH